MCEDCVLQSLLEHPAEAWKLILRPWLQVEWRPEVVLLSRSIQISGTDADFGCTIWLGPGSSHLEAVEAAGCGRRGSCEEAASLEIRGAKGTQLLDCSIHGSSSAGVVISRSRDVQMQDCTVTNVNGTAVKLLASSRLRYTSRHPCGYWRGYILEIDSCTVGFLGNEEMTGSCSASMVQHCI